MDLCINTTVVLIQRSMVKVEVTAIPNMVCR